MPARIYVIERTTDDGYTHSQVVLDELGYWPRQEDAQAYIDANLPDDGDDRYAAIELEPANVEPSKVEPATEFKPTGAPFGFEITAHDVQDVWDTFIKPGQENGDLQSAETRVLMGILREAYRVSGGAGAEATT